MKPEDIQQLLDAWRDGTISDGEARRLAEAMRADPAVAAEVRREQLFAGFAAQALEGDDGEAFVRSFRERRTAERQSTEFIKLLERRASSRRNARPAASAAWIWALPAAALFLVLLTAAIVTSRRREKPEPLVQATEPEPAPKVELPVTPLREARPTAAPRPPEPPRTEAPRPEPPPAPPQEVPREEVPVPKPAPAPKPAPVAPTRVLTGVARIEPLIGDVWLLQGGRRLKEKVVPSGSGVATDGLSQAAVIFPDGTRLTLEPGTVIHEIVRGPKGLRVQLDKGTLTGDIEKQPADQPLVFVTPQAEARVLGTVLKLGIEGGATRLEVRQGKVRLSRDGRSLDVSGGQYALAGPQGFVAPKPIHPDEVVLLPQHAKLIGGEWTLVRDPKSATSWALEAGQTTHKPWDHVEDRLSYVTYTFHASADREYRLWVRASSAERGDAWMRDQVVVEPVGAKLSRKCDKFGTHPTSAYVFTGVAATTGYVWLSGHGEAWNVEDPPITVRFNETGPQALRIYVGHPSVRIDSVWLSAAQKSRPAAKLLPPAER